MKHVGLLTATAENKAYCDTVTEISGSAYACAEADGAFPLLTIIGGNACAYVAGAFPLVTTIRGDACAYADGAFPLLTTLGGRGDACAEQVETQTTGTYNACLKLLVTRLERK